MKENNRFQKKILDFISSQDKPVGVKNISEFFNLDRNVIREVLKDLVNKGEILRHSSGKYSSVSMLDLYTGIIDGNPDGYAFFISENGSINDLFIPPNKLGGAIHGDRVAIRVDEYKGKKEACVVKVLERKNTLIVGRVEKSKHFAYVIPFMKKFFYDVYIPNKYSANLKDEEIVVCQIYKFPEKRKNPEGKIIKSLGFLSDKGIENKIVLEKYGLSKRFSKSVIDESKKISDTIDTKNRTDLRDLLTITIDGEDARDFDDAISLEEKQAGYTLYIHIADVAHYVKVGSAIDEEAFSRGTSVYFPEFAIPMLPERLSNNICSLNPNVDRLTMTVRIDYDLNRERLGVDFYESVIKSDYRLTYDEANELLENSKNIEDENLLRLLKSAEKLTKCLIDRKKEKGMLYFDLPEPQFLFDKEGELIGIKPLDRKISHRIIENFMLEANEVVSEFLEQKINSSIYRVHGEPDRSKIIEFIDLCNSFGLNLEEPKTINPKIIQKISEYIVTTSYSYILSSMLVRSMQRALYSTDNIGHFGLASKSYTHFTSPIRRYPDLIIHRLLKMYKFGYNFSVDEEWMEKAAKELSIKEELAEKAEREIHQYKKIRFLEKDYNKIYSGYINRVNSSGFFVFIESLMLTGFIPISSLEDDYYIFDSASSALFGKNRGKVYRVGDIVNVVASKINYDFLEVDFRLS
ncbi:MAG: ribonuclease R [Deferribacterota bacterium]|nr:ribonuclease R [Deferribacterota bacterium]